MNVISYPDQYGSVYADACFSISGLTGDSTDVEILGGDDARIVGVKRFYKTESCRVNVAPYMRRRFDIRPMNDYFTGLYDSTERAITCAVRCGTQSSESVYLTASSTGVATGRLLSDMPKSRTISSGQWDELSLLSPDEMVVVTIYMHGAGCDASVELTQQTLGADIATIVVDADDIAEMFVAETGKNKELMESFTIEIDSDYAPLATVFYKMDYSGCGERLAWVNRYGCVDYFTFPIVSSSTLSVEKQRIATPDGYRVVGVDSRRSTVLNSGYKSCGEVDALAAILASPRVWKISRGRIVTLMDVQTAQMQCSRYDRPLTVKLTLREAQPAVPQIM